MAVGCSHGDLIDPRARDAVLKFAKDFKPDHRIHLGDFLDTAALRAGAKGTKDESRDLVSDFDAGLGFLKEFGATLVFCGNHEARPFGLREHPNAIIAICAAALCERIEKTCKALKAELVQYHIINGWRELGGFRYGHGYMFGEQAPRDHAEAFGSCVHAHTHKPGVGKGRNLLNSTGYCVGTLSNIPCMEYATTRRATLAWASGFVWGYTDGKRSQLWLHEQPRGLDQWILPS